MFTVVKNLPAEAGDTGAVGSISESERSPGGGNGNPLQNSCLENPMDRRLWWATVHGVAKSRTQLNTDVYMCVKMFTSKSPEPVNTLCFLTRGN